MGIVFISYHSKDFELAKEIKFFLLRRKIDVLMYDPNEKWTHTFGAIADVISSCDVVLYIKNKHDRIISKYVKIELGISKNMDKKIYELSKDNWETVLSNIQIAKSTTDIYFPVSKSVMENIDKYLPEELEEAYNDELLSGRNLMEKQITHPFTAKVYIGLLVFILGVVIVIIMIFAFLIF